MADDINRINLVGRLTGDSELKYTTGGTPVMGFSIAVNRSVKKNGAWEQAAWFFNVTVWGKRGETLVTYLKKGTQVAIEGHLRQDQWDDNGYKKSRVLIELFDNEKIMLLGGKPRGEPGPAPQNKSVPGSGKRPATPPAKKENYQGYTPPSGPIGNDYEDDIPF